MFMVLAASATTMNVLDFKYLDHDAGPKTLQLFVVMVSSAY